MSASAPLMLAMPQIVIQLSPLIMHPAPNYYVEYVPEQMHASRRVILSSCIACLEFSSQHCLFDT